MTKGLTPTRTSTSPRSVAVRTVTGFNLSSWSPAPASIAVIYHFHLSVLYTWNSSITCEEKPFRDCLISSHNFIKSSLIYSEGSTSLTELLQTGAQTGKLNPWERIFQMHYYFLEASLPESSVLLLKSGPLPNLACYMKHVKCNIDRHLTDPPKCRASSSTKPSSLTYRYLPLHPS